MSSLESLIESVEKRKPISFEYNKVGKVKGERIGNVHAVFIFTSKKSGKQSTMLHVVQTGGVSDSKEKNPFPDFRSFKIEDISEVKVLKNRSNFEIFYEKYNPEWDGYNCPLAKV
ncbi:MAG: hypothetical protein WBG30_11605 [Psychrilyobacter sp.]|uniref:hypothetical protein n=1 Tax=Psychrilyobacter sp. TaxID=2586924 RepID=UPI003C76B23E